MNETFLRNRHARGTITILALLWIAYFVIEFFYITNLPLIMDEFQGAHEVLKFRNGLPYLDFLPYKTVLGYYLQLPVLAVVADPWMALLAVKAEMALLTAAIMFWVGLRLRETYSDGAILMGTALLVSMSTFLERSAELRVDMLTALVGLVAFVLLGRRRFFVSGLICALSFLVSQKGIYYLAASLVALVSAGLLRRDARLTLRSAFSFCGGAAASIFAYLALWSIVASPRAVMSSVFLSHVQIAVSELYDIRWHYWKQTLIRNPVFYFLAAAGLIILCRKLRSSPELSQMLLAPYALVIVAAGIWHKQPWPYFFVILLPTFYLLVVAAIDQASRTPALQTSRSARWTATILLVGGGILFPLLRINSNLARDQGVQRTTFQLGEALLADGGSYFAGMNYLYHRQQSPVSLLEWLDGPTVATIRKQSAAENLALIKALDETETKFLIRNYRIEALPAPFQLYFRSRFDHFRGNVYIYAPRVRAGNFPLKFSGRYRVDVPTGERITIDGYEYRSGDQVWLDRGPHTAEGKSTFRLRLSPQEDSPLDPKHLAPGELFPHVYDY